MNNVNLRLAALHEANEYPAALSYCMDNVNLRLAALHEANEYTAALSYCMNNVNFLLLFLLTSISVLNSK